MTDNEKAATFIGWHPGQICKGWSGCSHEEACEHGHIRMHGIDDPDMSRPENYMRALEAVLPTEELELHREKNHWTKPYTMVWCCFLATEHNYEDFDYLAEGRGATPGEAIIKALAALYDNIHKDDQVSEHGGSGA